MTELALLTFAHKLDYDTIAAKQSNVLKVMPFNSKVIISSRDISSSPPFQIIWDTQSFLVRVV